MMLAIERVLGSVHTCMPAVVVDFDISTQTATVQPSLQINMGGTLQTLPQISKVPVVFPSTATAWVRLPVAKGDQVMLHFSEQSLDKWAQGDGSPTATGTPHRFDLSDAIAVPGLRPNSKAFKAKGAPTSLEVTNGLGWLELSNDGRFNFSNGTTKFFDALVKLLQDIQLGQCASPGSPLVMPTFTTDLVALETLKL